MGTPVPREMHNDPGNVLTTRDMWDWFELYCTLHNISHAEGIRDLYKENKWLREQANRISDELMRLAASLKDISVE